MVCTAHCLRGHGADMHHIGMYSALVLVALWQTGERFPVLLAMYSTNNGDLASMAYSRVRIIMLSVLVLMYLLATTHLGVRWYWVRQAFVVEATTPEDSFYVFLEVKYFWVWVVSGLTFGLNTVIADSVLVSLSLYWCLVENSDSDL